MAIDTAVVQTASGLWVPVSTYDDLPDRLAARDAFGILSPWFKTTAQAYGKRTSPWDITPAIMLEMWAHELISMVTSYLGTLLVTADYEIVCASEEKRRYFQAMYAEVHRQYTLNASPALFFGYQPAIKSFDFRVPTSHDGAPVWNSEIEPYVLDDTEQLRPDKAAPSFNPDTGAFEGIQLVGHNVLIPVPFALWLTIGKWRGFGSYLGWGRARTTYEPWWDLHFTKDQRTLYVQRGADPTPIGWHPSGAYKDPISGQETPYRTFAKQIADAARAGMSITMPSDVYYNSADAGAVSTATSVKKWGLDLLVNKGDVTPFREIIRDELQSMCIGMLVPYQAVLDSKTAVLSGSSTAEILGDIAEHILIQDAIDLDDHLNDYVFPQIGAANFGPDSPPVYRRTKGLNATARAHMMKVMELLLTRADVDASIFDLATLGRGVNIPLVQDQQQKQELPVKEVELPGEGVQKEETPAEGVPSGDETNPNTTLPRTSPSIPPSGDDTGGAVSQTTRSTELQRLAHDVALRSDTVLWTLRQVAKRAEDRFGVLVELDTNDPNSVDAFFDALVQLAAADAGVTTEEMRKQLEEQGDRETAPVEEVDPFLGDSEEISDEEAAEAAVNVEALLERQETDEEAYASLGLLHRLAAYAGYAPARPKTKRQFRNAADEIERKLLQELERLVNTYQNGQAPSDVIQRMGRALRKAALESATLGKHERGAEGALTTEERKLVEQWYKTQQEHLRGVYKQMRTALDKPGQGMTTEESVARLADTLRNARMPMYANAVGANFEQHRARFATKKWPRSGHTECLVNCKCRLEWGEDATGIFVQWFLDPDAENCSTCRALADNGRKYREGEL